MVCATAGATTDDPPVGGICADPSTPATLTGAATTAWKSGTLGERRALLETLVERIEVRPGDRAGRFGNRFDPDRVHVVWRVLDGPAVTGP